MAISLAKHKILCVALAVMLVIAMIPAGFGQTRVNAAGQLETKNARLGFSVVYGYSQMIEALADNAVSTVQIPYGYSVTMTGDQSAYIPAGKSLIVNGTLGLSNINGTGISNSGTIRFMGDVSLYQSGYSSDRLISNSGNLYIEDGAVSISTRSVTGIYNSGYGHMQVSGGNISIHSNGGTGIESGSFEMSGGSILISGAASGESENYAMRLMGSPKIIGGNISVGSGVRNGISCNLLTLKGGTITVDENTINGYNGSRINVYEENSFTGPANLGSGFAYALYLDVRDSRTNESLNNYRFYGNSMNEIEYNGQKGILIREGVTEESKIYCVGYRMPTVQFGPIYKGGQTQTILLEPYANYPDIDYHSLMLHTGKSQEVEIDLGSYENRADYVEIKVDDPQVARIDKSRLDNDGNIVVTALAKGQTKIHYSFYKNGELFNWEYTDVAVGEGQLYDIYMLDGGTDYWWEASCSYDEAYEGVKIHIDHRYIPGWEFKGWSVVKGNIPIHHSEEEGYYFIMPSRNVEIRPLFEKISPVINQMRERELMISGYDSKENIAVNDGMQIRIPIYTDDFYWDEDVDQVTVEMLEANFVRVSRKVTTGSAAIKNIAMVNSENGVDILVTFQAPEKDMNFNFEIRLSWLGNLTHFTTGSITGTIEGKGSSGNNNGNGNNSGGGSGGGGSKGRSGADTYASSLLNRQDALAVNKDIAVADAKQALAAAKSQGTGKATMKIQNATSISLNVMKSISNEAKAAKLPLIVQADTVQNGVVQVRLSFDPQTATKDIQLSGSVNNTSVLQVKEHFEKFYTNTVTVIELSHIGDFGTSVQLAAKADMNGLKTENLRLYYYDKQANTYSVASDANLYIDANGYLRADITKGGYLVLADGTLKQK